METPNASQSKKTATPTSPDMDSPIPDRSSGAKQSSEPLIPDGLLPSFLAEAFRELYEEDGLMCLGKGLGWLSLFASFVRFYADINEGHLALLEENDELRMEVPTATPITAKKPPLVLALGLRDQEYESLTSILESWGTFPDMLPTIITNETGQGKDRASMYSRGGVFCVTSRILIVDLLTNVIASKDIDGLMIAHADQVTNESTEAFIIRIYTTQKRKNQGFIKAFSESPDGLLQGFARIDKTLKALHVRRLYLLPRFHDSVRTELERHQPIVEELHQALSPKMKEIQNAIVAAVQTCMRELKGSTPFLEWNGADLSIENCVTSSFDRAVSRQLEQDWHRLKPQTKQLVQDLRTLRTLFQTLIQYDCVSFWKLINSIKTLSAASRYPSMWLLSAAADVLFRRAKERIYTIQRGKPTARVPNPIGKLIPILEENPKWSLLKRVIQEALEANATRKANKIECPSILVMVKDDRTAYTLKKYLLEGRDKTILYRWLNYLENCNDRSRLKNDTNMSEESRLLLEEESRVRRVLFGNKRRKNPGSGSARGLNQVPDYIRKRRRIAVEKGRGVASEQKEDLDRRAVLDEAVVEAEHTLDDFARADETKDGPNVDKRPESIYDAMFRVEKPQEPRILIRTFSSIEGNQSGMLLTDLRPNYVILYDTDVAFIRSLEIYSNLHSEDIHKLKVYFLIFEASAEQKSFMKALEREQNAFERLIHHKKTMPPPILKVEGTQEIQEAIETGSDVNSYHGGELSLAFDTRQGKGRAKAKGEKRDVVVDVREFRSALPSILHQGGMRLAPLTLIVGDFVLSSVHCVERKSISDLFGSFASGRLYTQADAMSKYYECPCLLIEFDPAKSFCLQNSNELGVNIRTDAVCSKMAILTMHFPKLRILWSRSPHQTLHLFKDLKQSHDEVDVKKAAEVGRSESVEYLLNNGEADADEDEINEAARDMLLRLPGVNLNNARQIMKECDTLAELSEMSREELRRIAGPVAGQKLFTFFRRRWEGN